MFTQYITPENLHISQALGSFFQSTHFLLAFRKKQNTSIFSKNYLFFTNKMASYPSYPIVDI